MFTSSILWLQCNRRLGQYTRVFSPRYRYWRLWIGKKQTTSKYLHTTAQNNPPPETNHRSWRETQVYVQLNAHLLTQVHALYGLVYASNTYAQGLISALNYYHATQVTEFFAVSECAYTVHQTSTGFFLYVWVRVSVKKSGVSETV